MHLQNVVWTFESLSGFHLFQSSPASGLWVICGLQRIKLQAWGSCLPKAIPIVPAATAARSSRLPLLPPASFSCPFPKGKKVEGESRGRDGASTGAQYSNDGRGSTHAHGAVVRATLMACNRSLCGLQGVWLPAGWKWDSLALSLLWENNRIIWVNGFFIECWEICKNIISRLKEMKNETIGWTKIYTPISRGLMLFVPNLEIRCS